MKFAVATMTVHNSAGAAAAAAAAVLCLASETFERFKQRSATISNATLFCGTILSQRECFGASVTSAADRRALCRE